MKKNDRSIRSLVRPLIRFAAQDSISHIGSIGYGLQLTYETVKEALQTQSLRLTQAIDVLGLEELHDLTAKLSARHRNTSTNFMPFRRDWARSSAADRNMQGRESVGQPRAQATKSSRQDSWNSKSEE